MKCKICGIETETAKISIPDTWRELRPDLKYHEELCFSCSQYAESNRLPVPLRPLVILHAQKTAPAYLRNMKREPVGLPYKVEWLHDKVIMFVDHFARGTDWIGNSWSFNDISKYINQTEKGKRCGMSISTELAQELIYNYQTKWITKSVFDLSPSKAVCPACFDVFPAERADEYGRCESCSFGKPRKKTSHLVSNKLDHKEITMPNEKEDARVSKTLIQAVTMSASALALRVKNLATLRDKAEALADVKILLDALEVLTENWKAEIRDCPGFYEMFPDLDKKVLLQEGKNLSEIDNKVLDVLTLAEIKKIVKVTEKGLKEINHEDLILKYKVTTGKGKAEVQVRDLSQDDRKRLAEAKV